MLPIGQLPQNGLCATDTAGCLLPPIVQEKEEAAEPAVTQMILVQKWFEELKRRVATGK